MNPLKKYLEKLGVKEFSQLTEEEKETYRDWEETLEGRKITDKDVESFLLVQEQDVINKLIKENLSTREDIFLKMKLDMIRSIRAFLNGPRVEKEALESNIQKLI